MATSAVTNLPPGYSVEQPQSTLPAGYTVEQPQSQSAPAQPEDKRSFLQIAVDNSPSGADPENPGNPTQQGLNQMTPEDRESAQSQLATTAGISAAGTLAAPAMVEGASMAGRLGQAALQPIKDAIVEELPYLKSSPGLYIEHIAKQAMQWVAANPDKALKLVTSSGVLAAAAKVMLSKSGI